MPVTKRMRFEILRRDDYACQYCGQLAPDVVLTIDHVIPVALGGTDDASNLVTACKDCNAGKTSIQPDSPLVAKVGDVSATFALSMMDKFTRIKARIEAEAEYLEEFEDAWNVWGYGEGAERKTVPLPLEYKAGLRRWHVMGVPVELLTYAIDIAMRTTKVQNRDKFRYMAGVVWRTLENEEATYPLTPESALMYTSSEAERFAALEWSSGFNAGATRGRHGRDLVAQLIDGTGQFAPVDPIWGETEF